MKRKERLREYMKLIYNAEGACICDEARGE